MKFAAISVALVLTGCGAHSADPQPAYTPFTQTPSQVFASCEEAMQAGVPLPLVFGDPGWNDKLDTDHNGRACE